MDIDALLKRKRDAAPEDVGEQRTNNVIQTDEVVFDGQLEQGVELDYVLPDYYPEIFKILKCSLTPRVISCNVSGDGKLVLDGIVYIKVIYLAEGSSALHCIDQRYTYSRTADLSRKNLNAATMPMVTVVPKTDYCNCRAVSPRRIDVRGAVSCKTRAVCPVQYVLPAIPEELQVRTKELVCCGKTIGAEKIFTVREEIETGSSGIGFIIHSDAVPKLTDLRVIADKAVVKGNVSVSALYGLYDSEHAGCTETEHMTADIPISSILDAEGITDSHITTPEITVMNCELTSNTESGIISCELLVKCGVRAQKEETVVIPIDVYSTKCETEFTTSPVRFSTDPRSVTRQLPLRATLKCDSAEIRSVWDCRSELMNLTCRPKSESELMLTGQFCCSAVGMNSEGMPFFIEKQEAFEQSVPAANVDASTMIDFSACVTDTSYSIKSDGMLDISAQAELSGAVRNVSSVEAVSTVTVHEDKPKEKDSDYALRIFFSNEGEDCWSIAKRYNTTVEAVMRENDIEDENCSLSGMILIPTI